MKETGILMALSSLPSPYGVGDLGESARNFLRILGENGVSIWQLLPLNPTGYGNSPYQPYSSFAGDELYLSLEELAAAMGYIQLAAIYGIKMRDRAGALAVLLAAAWKNAAFCRGR